MIQSGQKTSLLIPSQLPEFVRDNPDYSNFVLFLQAYYEWMEQNGGVTDGSKNLLNYADIDKTSEEFIDYFTNDFLPYFPKDALLDKRKAIKIARQLYESKGTPASYEFLFRTLYNSSFDLFYTKDAVLRASDGIWYVAKSVRLDSTDENFLHIDNYRLFGETSKSIATVEKSVYNGTKIEVFISNIERLFQSGEIVRVVDNNNQDVLFNGQPLTAKIVGQINQININPNNRGLLYQPGDPVIVYGGLNSSTGIGASAKVGTTTKGSIQRINVLNGGYGYTASPNTLIQFTNAPGATAVVGSLDPNPASAEVIAFIPKDSIGLKQYITIGNTNYNFANVLISNANTTLANAFSFDTLTTYPISSVLVTNSGVGISQIPQITALSTYPNDGGGSPDLKSLGILAPIQISNGGEGYQVNDTIVFSGGSGYGAYANVSNVDANGAITTITYVYDYTGLPDAYPLGGLGYRADALPTVTVSSSNPSATNASIFVPGILGDGAQFSAVVDRVGSVGTIDITNYGEDYITTPNVSLKVQDVVVKNVNISNLPTKGNTVYQTVGSATSYTSYFDSIKLIAANNDPAESLYNLRVYNYNSNPNPNLVLKVDPNIEFVMANSAYDSTYNSNGVKNYGDGTAKANATFLNGLTISQGQYLNTRGQPSSFSVLEDENYNNFTYQITVEKEIAKYREILLSLLHPTGMKVIGKYLMSANITFDYTGTEALSQGYPLSHYTQDVNSNAVMVADWNNKSNNIVQFNNLNGANLSDFVTTNSIIQISQSIGPNVRSKVVSVDGDTVTLHSNTWLTFGNVANIQANSGSNVINIISLTGYYDIVNNGNYSNTENHLEDIVFPGDLVLVANNTEKVVESVDYTNGLIYLTTNLTDDANSYMSVNRTIDSTDVVIYSLVGAQYQ